MAEKAISTLYVNLVARTAQFDKGMKGGIKSIRKMQGSLSAATLGVAKWGAAIGVAATGALALMIKRTIDSVDALDKQAKALGLSTQNLAKFQYAAEISGASTEQLAVGIKMMEKNIADAAMGVGEARLIFSKLGVDIKKLSTLSPEEQFKSMADAINGLGTQGEKAQAMMRIFGESGIKLGSMLASGSKGIDKLGDEAERLGITLSNIDYASIVAAKDEMTRWGYVLDGLQQKMTAGILTPLQGVLELIAEFFGGIKAGELTVADFQRGFQIAFGIVGDFIQNAWILQLKFSNAIWGAIELLVKQYNWMIKITSAGFFDLEATLLDIEQKRDVLRRNIQKNERTSFSELLANKIAQIQKEKELTEAIREQGAVKAKMTRDERLYKEFTTEMDKAEKLKLFEQSKSELKAKDDAEKKRLQDIENEKWSWQEKTNFAIQQTQLLVDAVGTQNEEMFMLQKGLSIANVVMSTSEGVMKAWAQGGMFGGAMAGLIAATGVAQVAAIASQSYDRSGGSAASATGATVANAPTPQTNIYLQGDSFSPQDIAGMMSDLSERNIISGGVTVHG